MNDWARGILTYVVFLMLLVAVVGYETTLACVLIVGWTAAFVVWIVKQVRQS